MNLVNAGNESNDLQKRMIIGTLIKYQQLNQFGLTAISFGIGILLGIQVLLKITKK